MTFFQAIILGIVQGLTEFLPVSSSGHLVIFQHIFSLQEPPIIFDVSVHVATLLAVFVFFRKRIIQTSFRDWIIIGIGTIPTVIAGLLLKSHIETLFSSLILVATNLVITGFLMFGTHYLIIKRKNKKKQTRNIHWKQALWIGCCQACAIFPGISRSGSTVAGGIIAEVDREKAFEFSFLLSIPAIIGATLLQLEEVVSGSVILNFHISTLLYGSVFAFLFALISLQWFRHVIQKAQLWMFGVYCFIVGIGVGLWVLLI